MSNPTARLRTLVHELRRRHVFRVAVVYGVVAWIVLQGTSIVQPALMLPEWTNTLIVLLVAAGFPFALVFAWAYDITPTGVQRTPDAALPVTSRGGVVTVRTLRPDRAAAGTRSIAALPFVNLSRESADDYLSDGLTEELIDALTRVRGLRVPARTSSFAFRNSDLDVREIGERLQVDHVLEGSVRVAGNRLRMSVKLISVDDGYSIWSETFDRELGDVFQVQEEIARNVVQRVMGVALGTVGAEGPSPAQAHPHPRHNLEAFQLYLKGRWFWNRRAEPDLRRALDCFRQAIQSDPDYALAHAGLADTYALLLDYGLVSPQEALPITTRSAEHALRLAPALAESHTSMALARQFDWQWAESEAAFRRALELNPAYPVAIHRYALFLAWMGRASEALERIEQAARLDPVSLIIQSTVGWILYYARRFDDAAAQLQSTSEMDPHFINAHIARSLVLAAQGRPDESLREVEHLTGGADADHASPPTLARLAYVQGLAGQTEAARRTLDTLASRSASEYVSAYHRALPYLGLGDTNNALDWLERALRERAAGMLYLAAEPIWDAVRSEERFRRILDQLRFPQH